MKRKFAIARTPMLKVGITGGIGSGKTTACRMFEELGIPVYYADERAKYLMQHEHFLIEQLKKNFGDEVFENGKLNRTYLAQKVFGNELQLALLNSIVHPAVFRDTERWLDEQSPKNVPYTLKEAALLIESGSYRTLDKLIVVTAAPVVRIARVTQRDNTTAEAVIERIKHQMPDEEKTKLADFVIDNSGTVEALKKEVMEIHHQLVGLWSKKFA